MATTDKKKITREEFDALTARIVQLEQIVFVKVPGTHHANPSAVPQAEHQVAEAEKEFGTHVIDGRKSRFL